jgi:hypothetical protein
MTRSISRVSMLLLVPLAVFAFGSFAHAKEPKDVKTMCENHLKRVLMETYMHALGITFTQSRTWQPTSAQGGIGGDGVLTRADHSQMSFEWSCEYDVKTNKVLNAKHTKLKPIEGSKPAKKK